MCILTTKAAAATEVAAAATANEMKTHQQAHYNDLFHLLAVRLRSSSPSSSPTSSSSDVGTWVVQQEKSNPGAYLHVSRFNWRDYNMNGIHLEAYVLNNEIKSKQGVVALHCESEWPIEFRQKFVPQIAERIRGRLEGWSCYREYGTWKLNTSKERMSVCEVRVPFGASPDETMERIERQLRRLMTLCADIDEVITNCLRGIDSELFSSSNVAVRLTKEEVRKNDGLDHRPLWTVIDGYVVDCTKYAKFHPGGLRKILATDDKQTGWTGEEFGFSFTRGSNAHFPKTGQVFHEGIGKFEKLKTPVEVSFGKDGGGAITILGKLLP